MIKTQRLFIGLLFFSIIISSGNCFSQDSLRKGTWRVTTNVTQIALGDLSVFGEYYFKKNISIGISYGIIFPLKPGYSQISGGWEVNDDLYPIMVYKGYAARLYAKFYRLKKHKSYFSPLIMYKELHYDHYLFHDRNGQGEYQEYYERSETAKVISVQLLWGKEFSLHKLWIDLYGGLGARERIRNFQTFNCCYDTGHGCLGECTMHEPGSGSRIQYFPELHLGFRIGFQH